LVEDPIFGGHRDTEESSSIMTLIKLWGHGFLYSLFVGLAFVPLITFLVVIALFLPFFGLIVAAIVLFIIVGLINKTLSEYIWGIQGRGAWQSLTGHGGALLALLIAVDFPILIIELFLGYAYYSYYYLFMVITYGPMPIVQGYIARAVARYFEGSSSRRMPSDRYVPGGGYAPARPSRQTSRAAPGAALTTCPYCNSVFPYQDKDLTQEGTATCRSCGAVIRDPRYIPGSSGRGSSSRGYESRHPRDQDETEWG
jgi:hypothetical protein